jgi:lysophospholipase L1-like esterase
MYSFFILRLLINLPFLVAEAKNIRKLGVKLPALAQHLVIGSGTSTLLILGESTAAGVGSSSIERTLAGYVNRFLKRQFTIENIGKNGLTVKEAYSLFEKESDYSEKKHKGIFLYLGANDCFKLTNPDSFQENLKDLIEKISSKTNPDWIYLADIPPVHLFPAFSVRMRSFLNTQRHYLQEKLSEVSKKNPKIIFEPISLDLEPGFFSEDQIHPSDLGYQKIAEFAIQGIKRAGFLNE